MPLNCHNKSLSAGTVSPTCYEQVRHQASKVISTRVISEKGPLQQVLLCITQHSRWGQATWILRTPSSDYMIIMKKCIAQYKEQRDEENKSSDVSVPTQSCHLGQVLLHVLGWHRSCHCHIDTGRYMMTATLPDSSWTPPIVQRKYTWHVIYYFILFLSLCP